MCKETTPESYLGDGLYASYDGWHIKLRTPREGGDHVVYLEGQTLAEFEGFVRRIREQEKANV